MKKHWKLIAAGAALALAVMIPASSAMAATTKVAGGGNTTGTHIWTLDQAADGSLSTVSGHELVSAQSTHGNYMAQDGKTMYVNTFTADTMTGGYGLIKYTKNALGVWTRADFYPTNVGGVNVPVGMYCSTDTKSKNAPNVLEVGDIATGLNLFFTLPDANNPNGSWSALVGGTGTTCDMSFRENQNDDEAWGTGHHNNVYHFTNGGQTLDPAGSQFGVAKLGHQSRTFTLDDIEYMVWSDGSAGDLVFKTTSDNAEVARIHVIEGENHSMGLNLGMDSTATGSINGIVPNFALGELTGVQIKHVNGAITVDVKNTVPATGALPGDVCGLDIISVDGVWTRN